MSTQESVNRTDIEWIKESLTRIETQTTKTNGRVNRLEMWRERANGYVMGISAVVSIAVSATVYFIA